MASKNNKEDRIAAVIVTYNPDLARLKKVIGSVLSQVDFVVAVDNGSKNINEVKKIVAASGVELIKLGHNFGIAVALNRGIRRALSKSKDLDWILTLDHDTIVHSRAIATIMSRYRLLSADTKERIGILALSHKHHDSDPYTERLAENPKFLTKIFAQTSGNLIRKSVFKFASFREDFFIDQVDHEFDLQLLKKGLSIIEYDDALLDHSYGEREKSGTKGIDYYNERRLYYYTRNGTYLTRNYDGFPWSMYIVGIMTMYSRFLRVNGISGVPRGVSIFFRSFADGLNGKLGENKRISSMRLIR
jgi:rhamnosyltransferase